MRNPDRGFTLLDVLVATLLVSLALVAFLRLTIVVFGILGRTGTAEVRPARMRSVATAWAQSELEFIRQIGFRTVCPSANSQCEYWSPRDCIGNPATFPAPYRDEGPQPPAAFLAAHISIEYDPTGPPDELRTARVELYRSQVECDRRTPFLVAYTSLSSR